MSGVDEKKEDDIGARNPLADPDGEGGRREGGSERVERTRVLLRGYANIARPRVNCRPLESYKCTACRIYFVGAHIS